MMPPFRGKSLAELDEKVRKLVLAKARGDKTVKHNRKSWLDVADASRLVGAIEQNKPQITLSNGTFEIKYHPERASVFLRPADGAFVPCGWFSYESLRKMLV